jgi:hypothetical protein
MAISAENWEPLLSTARGLGCTHASLFGSAVRMPLRDAGDTDIHVVIPRVDRDSFASLAGAAESTIQPLAARLGRPSRIELRHGPFKAPRELQLHLIIDDEASVVRSPCALIAQRATTGHLLAGEPLVSKRTRCDWVGEARVELERWLDALAAREIAFRHWIFTPQPALVEGCCAAETSWDLSCLLRGAVRSSDLFYRAALWAISGQVTSSLLAELGEEEMSLDSLPESWDRIRDRAMAGIQQRLDRLSAM